jgi:hypothetical protein
MKSQRDLDEFKRLLTEATSRIPREYFLLLVANIPRLGPLVQYRERVYAYGTPPSASLPLADGAARRSIQSGYGWSS